MGDKHRALSPTLSMLTASGATGGGSPRKTTNAATDHPDHPANITKSPITSPTASITTTKYTTEIENKNSNSNNSSSVNNNNNNGDDDVADEGEADEDSQFNTTASGADVALDSVYTELGE